MSLQNVLDGCTWPSQDAELVQVLQDFIRSVTGSFCFQCLCTFVLCLRCSALVWGGLHQALMSSYVAQTQLQLQLTSIPRCTAPN